MLEHRQHAAASRPAATPRERGHLLRRVAVGAVANHRVRARDRHVGHRQAIDVDADVSRDRGDEPGAETGRRKPGAWSLS